METFGSYRIEELIGRGGMGEVYRAYDTRRDRVVALKLLPPALSDDRAFRERFERESRIAARLREPHIVPIHDFGEIDGRLFLDMRLVDGDDLESIVRHRPLGVAGAVEVVRQVASALDAAHASGLVHRDVKPSNILLTDHTDNHAGFAYLVDFGIARSATTDGSSATTRTDGLVGSVAYVAPERIADGRSDPRGDVYSLACVLFESLTGRPPFEGDAYQVMYAHVHRDPPMLDSVLDDLPAGLVDVVAKGMAKDPEDRYASAGAFAAAAAGHVAGTSEATTAVVPLVATSSTTERVPLVAARADDATPTRRRPRRRRRRRWLLAATFVVLLVAAGVTGGLYLTRDRFPLHLDDPAAQTVSLSGLAIDSAYEVSEDRELKKTVTLTNTGEAPVRFSWFEAVPVLSGSDPLIEPSYTELSEGSPVVYWRWTLDPRESFKLSWSTTVPTTEQLSVGYLEHVVELVAATTRHNDGAIHQAQAMLFDQGRFLYATPISAPASGGVSSARPTGATVTVSPTGSPLAGGGTSVSQSPPSTGGAPPGQGPSSGPGPSDTSSGGGAPPPNHAPAIEFAPVSKSEGDSVSFPVRASDSDSGDSANVTSVTNLPLGIRWDPASQALTGTISPDALKLTTSRFAKKVGVFSVVVTARDQHNASTTKSFGWQVTDTYTHMLDYTGKYGCACAGGSSIDVAQLVAPRFRAALDPSTTDDGNKIFRQGIAPGAVIAWGAAVDIWYGYNDHGEDVARGWP